jgi:hypothetical protein
MGPRLIKKDKKFEETEKFSDEFFEYIAASQCAINFLSGFYDAFEEVFGKGIGEAMFACVTEARTSKAKRKLRDQVDLVRQYIAEPKPNASRVARRAARNDNLAASKLRNLNRWRKDEFITGLAKIDLMLGNTSSGGGAPSAPTLKQILLHMNDTDDPSD